MESGKAEQGPLQSDLSAARSGRPAAALLRCSPAFLELGRAPGPAGSSGWPGLQGTPGAAAWAFLNTRISWLVSVGNGKGKNRQNLSLELGNNFESVLSYDRFRQKLFFANIQNPLKTFRVLTCATILSNKLL